MYAIRSYYGKSSAFPRKGGGCSHGETYLLDISYAHRTGGVPTRGTTSAHALRDSRFALLETDVGLRHPEDGGGGPDVFLERELRTDLPDLV